MSFQDSYHDPDAIRGRDIPWTPLVFTGFLILVFAYAFLTPYREGWPDTARLFAIGATGVGLVASVLVLAGQVRQVIRHRRSGADGDWPSLGPAATPMLPLLRHAGWMLGLVLILRLFGFLPAAIVFTVAYILVEARRPLRTAVIYTVVLVGTMLFVFTTLFELVWPRGEFDVIQEALLDLYRSVGG